jgi:hypothetical protein
LDVKISTSTVAGSVISKKKRVQSRNGFGKRHDVHELHDLLVDDLEVERRRRRVLQIVGRDERRFVRAGLEIGGIGTATLPALSLPADSGTAPSR